MPVGHAFTLVVCSECGAGQRNSVIDRLSEVVRRCPHGMLVAAECLLRSGWCANRQGDGVMLLLQPCALDRSALGPGRWEGPVVDDVDLDRVCDWIAEGRWEAGPLLSDQRSARW